MKMTTITSSNIESLGYDKLNEVLRVKFKGNEVVYRYTDVTLLEYNLMMTAPLSDVSIGSYFARNIKVNHKFTKISGEEPELCPGCQHPTHRHYYDADEDLRCLHVALEESTHGFIGRTWLGECDCLNKELLSVPLVQLDQTGDLLAQSVIISTARTVEQVVMLPQPVGLTSQQTDCPVRCDLCIALSAPVHHWTLRVPIASEDWSPEYRCKHCDAQGVAKPAAPFDYESSEANIREVGRQLDAERAAEAPIDDATDKEVM